MKTEPFDIHQHITDQIIAAIERGTATSTPAEAYYSNLLHELTHLRATKRVAIGNPASASATRLMRWKS
jgi:antirestriction protein ArdC